MPCRGCYGPPPGVTGVDIGTHNGLHFVAGAAAIDQPATTVTERVIDAAVRVQAHHAEICAVAARDHDPAIGLHCHGPGAVVAIDETSALVVFVDAIEAGTSTTIMPVLQLCIC